MPPATPTRSLACARGIGTAVLILSVFLFMLGTPPFAYGIWFQTEPVTVGLLVLGAVAGLVLLALDLTGHGVSLLLSRWHVRVLLLFLAWNALVSATQAFPGRAWFGTPETGEGIFSFLALTLLMLLAMAVWPYRGCRVAIAGGAVGACLIVAGLDALLPQFSAWRPEKYTGYAGLLGPPAMMIVAGAFGRPNWKTLGAAGLVGLAPVVFSANKTATVLVCLVGPIAYVLLRWLVARQPLDRSRRLLGWLPVVALAMTCLGIAAVTAYGDYDPLYSVRSRGLLAWAALRNFHDEPLALLTGFGWGHYNDLLYRHTFLPVVRGFIDGVWNPSWEGVGAGAFHSHNDILEAVLGGGAIGGILYTAFFAAVIAGARRRMMAIATTGWFLTVASLCFWYPFMFCYPFVAIAIAATTVPMGVLRAPAPASADGWSRSVCACLVVLLAAGAWLTYDDTRMGGDRLAALNRQDPAEIPRFGTFPSDRARGGVHLWWLALNEVALVDAQPTEVTEAQARWYERLLHEVDAWTEQGRAGVRLEALTLVMRNDLAANHERNALAALRERELPRWEGAMMRIVRHSPDRSDVAVPFMAFLAATKQYSRIIGVCDRIFALHQQDRVCLWYGGLAMLANPATIPAGLQAMRAGLTTGAEAVAPISKAVRTMVETEAAGRR